MFLACPEGPVSDSSLWISKAMGQGRALAGPGETSPAGR
ncbi:hypothetical protein FRAAL6134 [Frankia alni ACN14a]|uniref:Uncharacterized protein n=1 Tax=Frankia alni (strain DSM 45986 / CECT 9034 / ACN14a) TaxID=326424 RepID=Q0RCR7_FRAAA|nr:hypothetical protein FRAAL6134 [Frankia alni ACN14a]